MSTELRIQTKAVHGGARKDNFLGTINKSLHDQQLPHSR